jgi:hypothetical protein
MNPNRSGLAGKLAKMDLRVESTMRSLNEGPMYKMAWSIDDFAQFLEGFPVDEALPPQRFVIRPPDQSWTASLTIKCYPRHSTADDWDKKLTLKAVLDFSHGQPNNLIAGLSFGLLDKEGAEVINSCGLAIDGSEYKTSMLQQTLTEQADTLLPDGRLTIAAKVSFATWDEVVVENGANRIQHHRPQMTQPAGDLFDAMLESFVEIGGSVLLVFEDGEQRCHTFPLAARYDRYSILLKGQCHEIFDLWFFSSNNPP